MSLLLKTMEFCETHYLAQSGVVMSANCGYVPTANNYHAGGCGSYGPPYTEQSCHCGSLCLMCYTELTLTVLRILIIEKKQYTKTLEIFG